MHISDAEEEMETQCRKSVFKWNLSRPEQYNIDVSTPLDSQRWCWHLAKARDEKQLDFEWDKFTSKVLSV